MGELTPLIYLIRCILMFLISGFGNIKEAQDMLLNIQNTLYSKGARNFLFIDVPPIDRSPASREFRAIHLRAPRKANIVLQPGETKVNTTSTRGGTSVCKSAYEPSSPRIPTSLPSSFLRTIYSTDSSIIQRSMGLTKLLHMLPRAAFGTIIYIPRLRCMT